MAIDFVSDPKVNFAHADDGEGGHAGRKEVNGEFKAHWICDYFCYYRVTRQVDCTSFCLHKIDSCVLVQGVFTVTELLFDVNKS